MEKFYRTTKKVGDVAVMEFKNIKMIDKNKRSIAEICKGKSVLSIGCVDMIETKTLDNIIKDNNHQFYNISKTAKELVGIDINDIGIKKLESMGFEVYNYDIFSDETPPINDRYFDVLVLSHVIEHIPNCYEFVNRVIEKFNFGKIIIAVPNCYHQRNIISTIVNKSISESNDHYYTFSPFTLIKFMESLNINVNELFMDIEDIKIKPGKNRKVLGFLGSIVRKYLLKSYGDLIAIGSIIDKYEQAN